LPAPSKRIAMSVMEILPLPSGQYRQARRTPR
jgi:hypothetical protein